MGGLPSMLLRLGGVRSQSATMPVRMQGSCVPSPPSARACVCPRARPRTRAVAGRQARSGAGAPPAEQARAGMPVQWEHLGVQTTAFPVGNGPSTAGLYVFPQWQRLAVSPDSRGPEAAPATRVALQRTADVAHARGRPQWQRCPYGGSSQWRRGPRGRRHPRLQRHPRWLRRPL